MIETQHEGIPREQINWNPTINQQKCTQCGNCTQFCKRGVFTKQENQVTVTNPTNCKVYCKNCQKQCPTNAITHPDEEETKKHILKLQEMKA